MIVQEIELNKISVSNLNTRKDLVAGNEDSGIIELADSIKEKGLLNPITIRTTDNNNFEVVAGQRRYLACKKLGWEKIPCIIRELDDSDAVAISLIENVHRADMNAIDKAKAIKQLSEKNNNDTKIVSKQTGWSEVTIKKYLLLLKLPEEIQDNVNTAEGPARIETLSRIAKDFDSNQDMLNALQKIDGFSQQIQVQLLKNSNGNLDMLDEQVTKAHEGVFNLKQMTELDMLNSIKDFSKSYSEQFNNPPIDSLIEFIEKDEKKALSLLRKKFD